MFRHKGKNRTFKHNLLLAALLSSNAGLVNITGVLSLGVLTTNVTGHFAFFAEKLSLNQYQSAIHFLFYIIFFLLGAFFSSMLTEYYESKGKKTSHGVSMGIEIVLLFTVGYILRYTDLQINTILIATILLFAMGMQNSLVTQISNSTVRTTHLTGLFTDLGIELSQLFFHKKQDEREQLFKSIKLRLAIIIFFFLGGVFGGFLYKYIAEGTLLLASLILLFALFFDVFRMYFIKQRRLKSAIIILFIVSPISIHAQIKLPAKIIIGEEKGKGNAYAGYQMILNHTSEYSPYTILLEKGSGYCYFINLYISDRDTLAIYQLEHIGVNEKRFYEHLYKLNKRRSKKNKIVVKGYDLEHEHNYIYPVKAFYYMISEVSNTTIQTTADSIVSNDNKSNQGKAKELLHLIDNSRMVDLIKDDSTLQLIREKLYLSLKFGGPSSKSWLKNREKELINQFKASIFGLDKFCCITQLKHLPHQKGNPFLEKVPLKEFDIKYYYPIYINNKLTQQSYYCSYKKDPLKRNKALQTQLYSKSGAWLMSTEKHNYLLISN